MSEGTTRRWLMTAGAIGIILVLVFIAVAREPLELDADTPDGVVQRYLQALSDGEYETAFNYLDPDYYEDCDPADIARHHSDEPFSATLAETSTQAEFAFVEVTLRFGTGQGPFGGGWSTWEQFQLKTAGDSWLITGDAWPYFSWECREGGF